MLRGERPTIFGDGRQSRDFTYIDNVIRGNLLAAKEPAAVGLVCNVACGQQVTLLELVDAINSEIGTRIEPFFKERRAGDVLTSMADISLARRVLGYEPAVSFQEGLRRSIGYYRSLVK
jgi:UDP-glucose 4-epimerase